MLDKFSKQFWENFVSILKKQKTVDKISKIFLEIKIIHLWFENILRKYRVCQRKRFENVK